MLGFYISCMKLPLASSLSKKSGYARSFGPNKRKSQSRAQKGASPKSVVQYIYASGRAPTMQSSESRQWRSYAVKLHDAPAFLCSRPYVSLWPATQEMVLPKMKLPCAWVGLKLIADHTASLPTSLRLGRVEGRCTNNTTKTLMHIGPQCKPLDGKNGGHCCVVRLGVVGIQGVQA